MVWEVWWEVWWEEELPVPLGIWKTSRGYEGFAN